MERTGYPWGLVIWFGGRNGRYELYLGNNLQASGWYASTPTLSSPEYLLNQFSSDFRGISWSQVQGLYTPQCSILFFRVRISILVHALVADFPLRFW